MRIPANVYHTILGAMPIPCVDLLIVNDTDEVLLLRRFNDPCRGHWWFPGGRVHFNETRKSAAARKLAEECGLKAESFAELGTFDVLLPLTAQPGVSHAISTLYAVKLQGRPLVTMDSQSTEYAWKTPEHWKEQSLHPFVEEGISLFESATPAFRAIRRS